MRFVYRKAFVLLTLLTVGCTNVKNVALAKLSGTIDAGSNSVGSMSLLNPTSSPGYVSTPTVRVTTQASGDVATIYSDATCTTFEGSASATDHPPI